MSAKDNKKRIKGLGNNIVEHDDSFILTIRCPGNMRDHQIEIPKKIDENNAHEVLATIESKLQDVVHGIERYAPAVLQAKFRNLLGFGQ